jgi:hypothetical protein
MYVGAHESVRNGRVYQRDVEKRGQEEAARRWAMTQSYEGRLFAAGSPLRRSRTPVVAAVDNSLPAGDGGATRLRTLGALGPQAVEAVPEL